MMNSVPVQKLWNCDACVMVSENVSSIRRHRYLMQRSSTESDANEIMMHFYKYCSLSILSIVTLYKRMLPVIPTSFGPLRGYSYILIITLIYTK